MKKKQTNDEKIIAALDALDKSVRNLQKFGAKYDAYIDEAAIRGDDARAKQLIKQKIRVYALALLLEMPLEWDLLRLRASCVLPKTTAVIWYIPRRPIREIRAVLF